MPAPVHGRIRADGGRIEGERSNPGPKIEVAEHQDVRTIGPARDLAHGPARQADLHIVIPPAEVDPDPDQEEHDDGGRQTRDPEPAVGCHDPSYRKPGTASATQLTRCPGWSRGTLAPYPRLSAKISRRLGLVHSLQCLAHGTGLALTGSVGTAPATRRMRLRAAGQSPEQPRMR